MGSNESIQDLRISLYPPVSERSQALLELVASGRGSLDFVLGDAERRIRLLTHGLDWSRVVVAWRQGQPVGYAQMRFCGARPLSSWLASLHGRIWLATRRMGRVYISCRRIVEMAQPLLFLWTQSFATRTGSRHWRGLDQGCFGTRVPMRL